MRARCARVQFRASQFPHPGLFFCARSGEKPPPPMPSAWTQHLSAYRASHPSKSMKECMIEASACYRKGSPSADSKAVKRTKTASKKATYRGAALSSSNPWIAHVQAYRASHGCSYTEAMQGAKKTYRSAQQVFGDVVKIGFIKKRSQALRPQWSGEHTHFSFF